MDSVPEPILKPAVAHEIAAGVQRAGAIDDAWQHCLSLAAARRGHIPGLHQNPAGQSATRPSLLSTVPELRGQAAHELVELYAPLLDLRVSQRFAIGHLAQGVDGNIATDSGSSRGLSGEQNHIHLHRLRALVDAVIVGASTAALDDPQLTVRLVPGPSPVRLVLDPAVRLPTTLRLFNDHAVPSFIVCASDRLSAALSRWGSSRVLAIGTRDGLLELDTLHQQLHERGWPVVLVEGGGVTVSRMMQARALDRVHICVSPVLVGGTRRGLQLAAPNSIADCHRPSARVYRIGQDMMWDINLRTVPSSDSQFANGALERII